MKGTRKGDFLEAQFHQYLLDQQTEGRLIFDAYAPQTCKIFRKKKYPCNEREIEFDIVVEIRRVGRSEPHKYIVFECKNLARPVEETELTHFSTNVHRAFGHKGTAVLVMTSRLQTGALSFASSVGIAVVKYDEMGLETALERTGTPWLEKNFVRQQLVGKQTSAKSLKFSGYHNEQYFSSVMSLIQSLALDPSASSEVPPDGFNHEIQIISRAEINRKSQELLDHTSYIMGPVDLEQICNFISVNVEYPEDYYITSDEAEVLGTANFDSRKITIYQHSNQKRKRFTLAHEIGHFWLGHEKYLRSENVLAADIKRDSSEEYSFNYEILEIQANIFASCLLMKDNVFKNKLIEYRQKLEIRDRFHGALYVDDQVQNRTDYHAILSLLSDYFECSKQAVEIKLKTLNLLEDRRSTPTVPKGWQLLGQSGAT